MKKKGEVTTLEKIDKGQLFKLPCGCVFKKLSDPKKEKTLTGITKEGEIKTKEVGKKVITTQKVLSSKKCYEKMIGSEGNPVHDYHITPNTKVSPIKSDSEEYHQIVRLVFTGKKVIE